MRIFYILAVTLLLRKSKVTAIFTLSVYKM